MELANLMATLTAEGFALSVAGCNVIELRGPTHRLTPELRQALAEHKPALLAMLGPEVDEEREAIQREAEASEEATAFPFGANADDDWWDCLEPDDYARLTTPQRRPGPCAFCGGRTVHSQACQELRASWRSMRWGKYRGRPIDTVPTRYLAFVLDKRVGSSDDRAEILATLKVRQPQRYGTSAWLAKTFSVGRETA